MDQMEQMIKEKLLEELIDRMSGDDRMKPKGLGVEVQAPDKEHLAEGLDKAKDLLNKGAAEEPELEAQPDNSEEDDEQRLLALLEDEGAEEDEEGR